VSKDFSRDEIVLFGRFPPTGWRQWRSRFERVWQVTAWSAPINWGAVAAPNSTRDLRPWLIRSIALSLTGEPSPIGHRLIRGLPHNETVSTESYLYLEAVFKCGSAHVYGFFRENRRICRGTLGRKCFTRWEARHGRSPPRPIKELIDTGGVSAWVFDLLGDYGRGCWCVGVGVRSGGSFLENRQIGGQRSVSVVITEKTNFETKHF
jgi:hypothetical protein